MCSRYVRTCIWYATHDSSLHEDDFHSVRWENDLLGTFQIITNQLRPGQQHNSRTVPNGEKTKRSRQQLEINGSRTYSSQLKRSGPRDTSDSINRSPVQIYNFFFSASYISRNITSNPILSLAVAGTIPHWYVGSPPDTDCWRAAHQSLMHHVMYVTRCNSRKILHRIVNSLRVGKVPWVVGSSPNLRAHAIRGVSLRSSGRRRRANVSTSI